MEPQRESGRALTKWMSRVAALWVAVGLVLAVAPAAYAQPQHSLQDLVDAAVRRLQVAEPIAANKLHTGGAIQDPVREQQVLDAVSAEATTLGIDPAYVTAAFRDQIDATIGIEYTRLGEWTFDPASAPVDAPDLTSSRVIIDALNREMVTLMADEWGALHSPTCLADLDVAKMAVVQARALDPLYRQAVDFATRNYCR